MVEAHTKRTKRLHIFACIWAVRTSLTGAGSAFPVGQSVGEICDREGDMDYGIRKTFKTMPLPLLAPE